MTAQGVQLGLLGPILVRTGDGPIRIGSATSRLVLALLLVEADRVVPADRLVEEIWGNELPVDPRAALRTQMSRLRRALEPVAVDLVTEATGYRLVVQRAQLDVARFEDLVADARRTEGEEAAELLREALALWRGPALGEFADRPFAQPYAVHLEALRLEARERRAGLLLSINQVGEAVDALRALVMEEPGREHARGLLMEALYRLGRHPEALSVYQEGRRYLAEELGLEPSPRLRELERAILEHALAADRGASAGRPGRELPVPVSSFVGREDELAALDTMLGEFRLVTLVGPGGVGKTRLALRAAHAATSRYADGVRFCDFATVRRDAEVVRAMAAAVGVEERARRPFADQVIDALRGRRMLLVLDNCEHVLDGVARICGQLIGQTAGIDLLATSRERLAVDGERCWPVRPLATEGDDAPAVRLFLDRAEAVDPALRATPEDQATICDICRRLDGLPLAIELAAVRTRGLGVQELARSLHQRFGLLTAGPRATRRHRSLEAVVEWSYERLAPAERAVFNRLAVFVSVFDLDAAREVVASDDVSAAEVNEIVPRLVDQSLVNEHRDDNSVSYSLLETLREYGAEKLESEGMLSAVRDRHARWALALAEHSARGLAGPDEAFWVRRVQRHLADLRAAHSWLVGHDQEGSLRLAAALHPYALWRCESAVFRWAEVAAAAAAGSGSPLLPAVLASASAGAWQRGDLDAAEAAARAAADAASGHERIDTRQALEALGEVALLRGDRDAVELYREAYERSLQAGDLLQAVWDIGSASLAFLYRDDAAAASALAPKVVDVAREGGSPSALAFAEFVLGEIAAIEESPAAEEHLRRSVELANSANSRNVRGIAEVSLATYYARRGQEAEALRYYESVIAQWQGVRAWTAQWVTLRTLVDLLIRLEAHREAAVLYGAVSSARTGAPVYGADAARLREAEARLRAALGADTFVECTGEGAAMEGNDIVTAALMAVRKASERLCRADRVLAVLLYTDIVGSTREAARIGDARWSDLLDRHDRMVRTELERFSGRVVKMTGDGVLATLDGPARAIDCACAIRDGARQLGLDVRVGVHAGEVERRGEDLAGIALHVARRVCDLAGAGEVFVTGTVKDLVAGSGINLVDRGVHELKGVRDAWRIFAVEQRGG